MKKAAFVLITVVVAVVIVCIGVEFMAVVVLTLKEGSYVSARERFRREANRYVQDVTRGGRSCQYIDSLFPHPYLAFVHHGNPPCGVPGINNIGLFGPDFPSEKIRDRFVLLVTGGSVAAQFGQVVPGGPRHLEVALNKRYLSPTGKPFLVLNGGDGAWSQPQQTILFLLYSDVVDAVITLDGFNEHSRLGRKKRFEYPANNFVIANPVAGGGDTVVLARWVLGRLVGYASQHPVLSHSHAVFALARETRRFVERIGITDMRRRFRLPDSWDREKRLEWALGQYKKYIRALNAVARERRVLAASFIQPAPAIGKRLTPDEQKVVGALSYAPLYQRMTDALLELRNERLEVFSLLQIFREIETTLYADPVHLESDSRGESMGYHLMAEEMALRLAESWNLKRRR